MFNRQDMEEIISRLNEINAPLVKGNISEIGGKDSPSLHILISIDPKETWINNILENSRYAHFFYFTSQGYQTDPGKLYTSVDRIGKFRKCTPKSVQDLLNRINKYLDDNR